MKALLGLMVAAMALGCSAADETVVEGAEGQRPPGDAWIVDPYETVEWAGGRVDFYDASGPEGPSVVMMRMGELRDGDIIARLQEQSEVPLSAAEVWRALTGRADVPELLARAHQAQALESGRSPEYVELDVNAPVDKAVPGFVFASMFPRPAISGNNCWENIILKSINVGDILAPTLHEAYACSSGNPIGQGNTFVKRGTLTLSSACPSSLNTKRYVRVATYNGSGGPEQTQACFASGSGSWQCSRVFDFPATAYFGQDWPDDGSNHRAGVTAFALNAVPNGEGQAYGAALLNKTRPPAFGSTSCVTLVTGPQLQPL